MSWTNLIPWRQKEPARNGGTAMAPIEQFHTEVDRMFNRFFGEDWNQMGSPMWAAESWSPSLEVSENDQEVTVITEVPGVDPKDIQIDVAGDVLTISGSKKEESNRKDRAVFHSERRYGSFRRSVALPAEIDSENVSAEHKNGILTVRLKKSPRAAGRRIPVTAA